MNTDISTRFQNNNDITFNDEDGSGYSVANYSENNFGSGQWSVNTDISTRVKNNDNITFNTVDGTGYTNFNYSDAIYSIGTGTYGDRIYYCNTTVNRPVEQGLIGLEQGLIPPPNHISQLNHFIAFSGYGNQIDYNILYVDYFYIPEGNYIIDLWIAKRLYGNDYIEFITTCNIDGSPSNTIEVIPLLNTVNEWNKYSYPFYSVGNSYKLQINLYGYETNQVIGIASVKIFKNEFKGHIEQKNKAIDLCNGTWILSLDADERISPELKSEIVDILNKNEIEFQGYKIPRLTYHIGKFIKHSGWYPLKRYRFFLKGYAKWIGENPHDYIEISGNGSSLKGDIIHFSFRDLTHQVDTINKFSSIVAYTRFIKNTKSPILKSIYKPFIKFLEIYIFKLGFLDGYAGLIIAISSSYSTFLKFAKLYELQKGLIKRPSNLRKDYGKND